jgi:hypothetical protein
MKTKTMKKQTKAWSFLLSATMAILIGGCNDSLVDDLPPVQNLSYFELENGTMKFHTIEAYQTFLESKDRMKIPEFNSFAKAIKSDPELLNTNSRLSENGSSFIQALDGSILLEILDSDGMIIIDNRLFYLDFNNKIVVVSTDIDLRNAILQQDYSSNSIKLFGFDEDVFGLVSTQEESLINKNIANRIAYSFDPNAANHYDDKLNSSIEGTSFQGSDPYEYRLEAKHVYQKVGIYFRLFSESKHMRRQSGSYLTYNSEATSLYIWYNFRYLSKKNGSTEAIGNSVANIFSDKLKPVYYESSRGLEKHWLKSQFYALPGGNHGFSPIGEFWQFNLKELKEGY